MWNVPIPHSRDPHSGRHADYLEVIPPTGPINRPGACRSLPPAIAVRQTRIDIVTLRSAAISPTVKSRPSRSGVPIAPRYPGTAICCVARIGGVSGWSARPTRRFSWFREWQRVRGASPLYSRNRAYPIRVHPAGSPHLCSSCGYLLDVDRHPGGHHVCRIEAQRRMHQIQERPQHQAPHASGTIDSATSATTSVRCNLRAPEPAVSVRPARSRWPVFPMPAAMPAQSEEHAGDHR